MWRTAGIKAGAAASDGNLMRRRHVLAIALALAAVFPSSAGAAGWRCEASALTGTVLGAELPAVKANAGARDCPSQKAGGAIDLPPPLEATAVSATTGLAGPAGRPAEQTAVAAGGVVDLTVKALPTLPIALPEIPIPAELAALEVDISILPDPLNLIPDTITVDLNPAIDALLPERRLPTVDLLKVQAAVAYAAGRCANGVPRVAGASQIAGITVVGQELPTDAAAEQVVSLIDTSSIDLSNLDLALIELPLGLSFDDPLIGGLLEDAVRAALDALPPIEIPATLAHVKVTPGAQTTAGDLLTQRALQVEASIAGQPLADLRVGEASAGTGDVDCTPATAPAPGAPATSTELALQCTERRLVLIDVLQRDGRVKLLGAADRSLAGRTVDIVFGATGKVVARARVRADGSFSGTAPLPRRGLRRTNRARYRAVLGSERSLNLKLARRMVVSRMTSAAGTVTIAGRVIRPLAKPREMITVKRRVSCTESEVVGRFKTRRNGRFRITVDAPEGESAAVYRLQTRVRNNRRSAKTFPTYTLPRAVNLG